MRLLRVASRLNDRHVQVLKAAEERSRQAELQSRRLSYYLEFGEKWFSNLSSQIDELISEFNAATGEHSKLTRAPYRDVTAEVIPVYFISPHKRDISGQFSCLISRNPQEPRVSVDIQNNEGFCKEEYEVVVDKQFSELRVSVKAIEKVLGHGRNRETGDIDYEYEPTGALYKDVTKSYDFNSREFADFVLARFTEKMLQMLILSC